MLTSLGLLEEPLGNSRLHVARLVASLLYTSSASHAVVAQTLCQLNTMDVLLVRHSAVIHLYIHTYIYLSIHLTIYIHISIYRSICIHTYILSIYINLYI